MLYTTDPLKLRPLRDTRLSQGVTKRADLDHSNLSYGEAEDGTKSPPKDVKPSSLFVSSINRTGTNSTRGTSVSPKSMDSRMSN